MIHGATRSVGEADKEQLVGWIGAGKMGGPMARNLLADGISVMVSEPDATSRAALTQAGAQAAESLTALADTGIVFATLPNDQVLHDVVFGTAGPGLADILPSGAVFVEMSTVSPECSEAVAKRLKAAGIEYLRAPLSGSTDLAAKAALTVLASGDQAAWDKALPYLEKLSARRFYLGPAEEAGLRREPCQFAGQLPGFAENQQAHAFTPSLSPTPARDCSARHQGSLARYQSTVFSSPCSSVTEGRQPSSVRIRLGSMA